jgi:hypothetical protein
LREEILFPGNVRPPLEIFIYDENPIIKKMTSPENPHRQLIETICHEVLPNMVRIYESQRMEQVLDYD